MACRPNQAKLLLRTTGDRVSEGIGRDSLPMGSLPSSWRATGKATNGMPLCVYVWRWKMWKYLSHRCLFLGEIVTRNISWKGQVGGDMGSFKSGDPRTVEDEQITEIYRERLTESPAEVAANEFKVTRSSWLMVSLQLCWVEAEQRIDLVKEDNFSCQLLPRTT